MSKKVVLFCVVLTGAGLLLLLEHGSFRKDDHISSPDAMSTPLVSTESDRADKLLDETRESERILNADTGGLYSSVKWRDNENQSPDEYPRTYAELRELAEAGDVEATRRLAALLQSCRKAVLPITEAEIAAIVAEMRATYSYPMLRDGKFEFLLPATGELSHKMSPSEFERFIDEWHSNVTASATKCNDITLAQRNEADHWRDVFKAQGGVPNSWDDATRNMDHDAKIAYIDNLWAMGDPQALAAYADFYSEQGIQITDPSARVKSYAYIYAFYEALIETAKHHSNAERLVELDWALNQIHENYNAVLSELEIREAHELARQTIADNDNCCMRLPLSNN